MRAMTGIAALLIGLPGLVPLTGTNLHSGPPVAGHVVEIRMVDSGGGQYHFAPAKVTVQQGDTVRWLESSGAPHNVQFDHWPKGAKLGSSQTGPLLTSKGATYQLVIDARFTPGTYAYECTPHGPLGMKAELTVTP